MLHVVIPGKWRKESVFLTRDWPGGERRDQGLQLRVFLLGAVVRRFRADHAGGGRPVLVAAQESVLVWRERQPTHNQPSKRHKYHIIRRQVRPVSSALPVNVLLYEHICTAWQCINERIYQ
jgi:hypothetical protein